MSGENTLRGYIYGENNDKGLIVVSHGIGGGHEGYINEIVWFVRTDGEFLLMIAPKLRERRRGHHGIASVCA